ncbi:MAG TPA: ATP-binding protein [Nitrospirota bacterium]|nr:ATP-binding protein [Nitrospirota bacterium]
MFNLFANITPIYLLYLVYGAAFLFLGVSIAAKDMKGSDLQLAENLWLLGTFGFLHGAHEWLELGPLIEGRNLSFEQIFAAKSAAAFLVVLSFMFLLQFGISLVRVLADRRVRWASSLPVVLFLIWALYLWQFGFRQEGYHIDMQTLFQADLGARYTFGFAGGLITAYGLIAYSREVMILSSSASKKLSYAGITFIFYAVFAGIFSSSYSVPLLPLPVELLRGVTAFFMTYFIVNVLNIFDIEARKKVEQQTRRLVQAEKLTSLGQLAAGIAHEINNPLANASLGIQKLKNKLQTSGRAEDVVEKLDTVEWNIDRASAIAQELLQFSRQRESEFVPLDVNTVIKGALTLMQYKLNMISTQLDLAPVPDIMGDPGKLEQVFINILSNSLEAMPDGGSISLSSSRDGDFVRVQIIDSGMGIAAENLSRVFDPFFTTKEVGQGTGLGLSISYGIIKQHHGTISITSAYGKGTTLTIKLPIRGAA